MVASFDSISKMHPRLVGTSITVICCLVSFAKFFNLKVDFFLNSHYSEPHVARSKNRNGVKLGIETRLIMTWEVGFREKKI